MNPQFEKALALLVLGIGFIGLSKALDFFDLMQEPSSSTLVGTGMGMALVSLLWMIILKFFRHTGES